MEERKPLIKIEGELPTGDRIRSDTGRRICPEVLMLIVLRIFILDLIELRLTPVKEKLFFVTLCNSIFLKKDKKSLNFFY